MSVQSNASHTTVHALADAVERLEREVALLVVVPVGAVSVGLGILALLIVTGLDAIGEGAHALLGKTRSF